MINVYTSFKNVILNIFIIKSLPISGSNLLSTSVMIKIDPLLIDLISIFK